ncbi:MAG: lytic murein transglycosylase B [Coxiellaceae bacterium]|nr:lytic murein transglycosylase B [Coxiellaceae bacterium]
MLRVIILSLLFISSPLLAATKSKTTDPQQQIQQFINVMVKKYNFKNNYLQEILASRGPNKAIIKKITFPYESKPWAVYRKYFVTKTRIKNGAKYWREHAKTLQAAEKKYGVPASVIVAIIGVESNYGTHAAAFNELDALTTLAFYYPKRSKFFRRELQQFLILTRKQKVDPTTIYGSYAGALGIPQFMPSSYRHYGVDFDQSGHVDLLANHNDAIGSIANYLHKNGWKRNQPVGAAAKVTNKRALKYLKTKKKLRVVQWRRNGITTKEKLPLNAKARLIEMGKNDKDYWLTFRNFKAIMSYNPRTPYAMAVYQLSEEIKQAYAS